MSTLNNMASLERKNHSDATPALPVWLLRYRGVLIWAFHMALALASSYIAFLIRFDGAIPARYVMVWTNTWAALLVARGAMFVVFRLYEGLWKYTSVDDLLNILLSVGLSSLLFFVVIRRTDRALLSALDSADRCPPLDGPRRRRPARGSRPSRPGRGKWWTTGPRSTAPAMPARPLSAR